ncbi:kelch-like protein 38 isoform X2 [Perognathus longimembris pacificus]|uniref:kelch-like protein 38 isoform X2 n=1 Tax=Perognathus longimembris pacificus TaxID=214514 RepID=UPI002019050D|nr:kelch-like protein 38 isoform X2 [Perognathus longimembris pacificus]
MVSLRARGRHFLGGQDRPGIGGCHCRKTRMDEESPDGMLFKDQNFSSELLKQLNDLRHLRLLTDVSICTGTWEAPCHRNVLASSSPYFRAMFCSHFRESREVRVQLQGVEARALEQVVGYVYTGEAHITTSNVLALMEAASMLQYPRLFEACSSFLQSQLAPSNCLGMARLSEVLSCETLKKKAREVALTCFPEVAASSDLKELGALELKDYLGDDGLCGEEEKVFEALMAWVKHDVQARRRYLQELLQQVRLQYIHPAFFHHFIANDALLQSSPACQDILELARRQVFSLYGTSAQDSPPLGHIPPRNSYQDFLLLLGGRKDNQQTTREVLLYSALTGQWRNLAKLPTRLYKASAVALHRSVYVLGGMAISAGQSLISHKVYIFSLKLNQWRLGEPMLAARYSHRSTAHKNFIFSIGGLGEGQEVLASMERYDSICDAWQTMASMPVGVLHPAVAVKDQRLYLFGGEDVMQNPVRLIQVYHISRNTWFKMETRMIKNVCAPAVVLGQRIVIVGGYTRRILAYDPQSNKFVKCADMKDRRMHHGATVMGNKLYVTGGRRLTTDCSIEDSASFDCYDPETDTWTSQGQLPYKLFDHACLTLQCIPHTATLP